MTETWMTSIDSMLTKGWIGDILTVTCVREPVIFYVHVLHWDCAYWNFKPHFLEYKTMDFDRK